MKSSTQTKTTLFIILALCAVYAFTAVGIVRAEEATTADIAHPKIKALENRIQQNREVRNALLDQRKDIRTVASTTIKNLRVEERADLKIIRASTTEMFKKSKEIRKEISKKMEARVFEIRKNALIKELNISLTNLTNISTRIDARITKAEGEGRTMTEAKALLVIAKDKLEKAKTAVAAFQTLNLSTGNTTTTVGATVQVDLVKPRVAGDAAIKSVKEARDAFQKVVVAIAHAMGLKLGVTASTTSERNDEHESTSTSH